MLRVERATVELNGFTILRDLDLEVPGGEIVGLIGRNGAGKTTTIRTIMGLIELKAGRIELDGQDLGGSPAHQRARRGIGYLPQERRLIPGLSVEQNLLLPAWAMTLPNAEARLETIYELMPEVFAFRLRPAATLSGGQQKLTALARSFMAGSKLLLLDEPFEGVAPALAQRLVKVVGDLQQAQADLAVLVCESDFKWARRLASRIYVIERGEAWEEQPDPSSPA
jgi:branched-chain amino acid transport system ATP-binding protein